MSPWLQNSRSTRRFYICHIQELEKGYKLVPIHKRILRHWALRILGDSGFVLQVLEDSEERFERYYELKRLGYDLKTVEDRVCEIFNIGRKDIYSGSREKTKAEARGLFCYWAVRELGYALTDLSRRLGMTQPGVGYAVKRGEQYAEENNCRLIEI